MFNFRIAKLQVIMNLEWLNYSFVFFYIKHILNYKCKYIDIDTTIIV